jgi:voltage-gated potassium channel
VKRSKAPHVRGATTEIGVGLVAVTLVAIALAPHRPGLIGVLVLTVTALVVAVRRLLPTAPYLASTLAVCIPLYICLFGLIALEIFSRAHPLVAYVACMMPLGAFVAGIWRKRAALLLGLASGGRRDRLLVRGLGWLLLAILILSVAGQVAIAGKTVISHSVPLFLGMLAISLLVYRVIADLVLLLEAIGHLFVVFIHRMMRRVVPVFSFLVVYCFLVMAFGTLYSILDSLAGETQFSILGSVRPIDFGEAMYFSMITLSTIGYGDIVPVTSLARTFVMLEIMFGVVLLLFAFAEIAAYDPEAEEAAARDRDERDPS